MAEHTREKALKDFDSYEKLEITEVNYTNDHCWIETQRIILVGFTMDSSVE